METIECRITPPSKKFIATFLEENGEEMDNSPQNVYFVPREKVLICLTDDTVFQNAFVVFSQTILKHFLNHQKQLLRTWFLLPKKVAEDHSDWDGIKEYN